MKPDWYELASLLKDNEEIDIAFIDSDKNRTDPRYIWEGSIPLMKLFVKGRKSSPILYEGERQVSAWLEFLAQECKVKAGGGLLKAWFAYAASSSRGGWARCAPRCPRGQPERDVPDN